MNISKTATALAGASALAIGAGMLGSTAEAAAIVQSSAFDTDDLGGLDTLGFGQFDSSLGTLTSVEFHVSPSTTTVNGTINWAAGEGGGAQGLITATFNISAPGAANLFNGNGSADPACNRPSSGSCSASDPSPTLPVFSPNPVIQTTLPFDVGLIGGSFFLVYVEATITDTDVTSCTANFGATPTCSVSDAAARWTGTLEITFNYEPFIVAEVPEPATLAILGAGLLGLGAVRRRTHRI